MGTSSFSHKELSSGEERLNDGLTFEGVVVQLLIIALGIFFEPWLQSSCFLRKRTTPYNYIKGKAVKILWYGPRKSAPEVHVSDLSTGSS